VLFLSRAHRDLDRHVDAPLARAVGDGFFDPMKDVVAFADRKAFEGVEQVEVAKRAGQIRGCGIGHGVLVDAEHDGDPIAGLDVRVAARASVELQTMTSAAARHDAGANFDRAVHGGNDGNRASLSDRTAHRCRDRDRVVALLVIEARREFERAWLRGHVTSYHRVASTSEQMSICANLSRLDRKRKQV
jgi:hypothetical protein